MWSKNYEKCIECGTVESPHQGYGLCRNCYMRKIRSEHPEIYKEMDRRSKQTPEYKAKQKEYRQRPEVKESQKKRSLLYKERHPERMKEIQDRWKLKHPTAHRDYARRPEVKEHQRKMMLIRKYGEVALFVLERDNNKCQKCSKEEPHIHHIDWDKTNNSPDNLIILCNSCHKVLHSWIPKDMRRNIFNLWMTLPLEETAVYLKE